MVVKKKSSKKKSTKKIFVLDTNVILNDCSSPFSFEGQQVIIPKIVLKEVDQNKSSMKGGVGYNARAFARKVRELIKEQKGIQLKLEHGGTLTFELKCFVKESSIYNLKDSPTNDERIISVAEYYHNNKKEEVVLVTNDAHIAIVAHNLGIKVEGYEFRAADSFYTGVSIVYVTQEQIDDLYKKEPVFLSEKTNPNLRYNQVLVLKQGEGVSSSGFALFKGYEEPIQKFKAPNKNDLNVAGIKPLNKEQHFALEILLDKEVKCMTMTGRAGTGKSIVSLAYAIQCLDKKKFDKILIMKPIVPVGKDVGFLPGDLDEKMLHWTASFRDSLDVIFKEHEKFEGKSDAFGSKVVAEKSYDQYFHVGKIEFRPFTFIRGRNFQNTLIIVDECQNCDKHEIKTLLTRSSEGTELILLGDIDQIDHPYLDRDNNGLSYVVGKAKDATMFGHIHLIKGQRGEIAEWVANNL